MVWSKYVFPSIRIVIWFVIAAALVKIAFGSVAPPVTEGNEEFPTSEFSGGMHVVERASITSTLEVPASIVVDPSVEVKAGAVGTMGYWAVADGEAVVKGQALADIHVPIMSKRTVDADGMVIEPHDTGYFTRHTLFAPISGKITRALVLKEETTKSSLAFTVHPGTLSVEGTLTPQEQFKLVDLPETTKVSLTGGPEPFICRNLALGTDLVKVDNNSGGDDNPDSQDGNMEMPGDMGTGGESPDQTVGVKLKCIAPDDTRLIAGLDGTMSILAGEVKDAVVVPITAVQTIKDVGRVWVVNEETGEETERELVLGLAQGQIVEVKKGLDSGETIRQYAPGNMEEIPQDQMMMGY